MALTTHEFYILEPKAATNLIANPSFETSTDGWEVTGGAMARSTTEQRRGAYSLQIAPTNLTKSLAYYEITTNLTSSVEYNFSVDVKSSASSLAYTSYFATTGDVALTTPTSWTGNGHWQRRANSYTSTDAINVRLYVTCSSDATSDDLWYIDGAQLELGAESTYFDGDMTGFVVGQTDFWWEGTAHASKSHRSGQTRMGGTRMRVKDVLPALTVIGLGLSPIVNNLQPHNLGGSHYQNTISVDRAFSLVGELNPATQGEWLTDRQDLIDAISYQETATPQPIVMQYKGTDLTGNEMAEVCNIPCLYSGGLEGNWEEFGNEVIPLQFQSYLPFVQADGEAGASLTYNTSLASADYAVRMTSGTWSGISDALSGAVFALAKAPDGQIYMGGAFANLGTSDGDAITKYNPATGTFTALGSGMQTYTDGVRALAVAPNGDLYAGGDFAGAGGVANTAKIARWDGTQWNALATGMSTGTVYALAIGPDGSVYAGGSFTDIGDANGDYIVKWTGSAWASLGSGADSNVYAIAVAPDGTVYLTGNFANAGGVACAKIAKWNGTAFTPLSSGLTTGAGLDVGEGLTFDASGNLYVTGEFAQAGGVSASRIAMWNGTSFKALGSGLNTTAYATAMLSDGTLVAVGDFTTAGGLTLPDRVAAWNGSSWVYVDVDLPGTPIVYAVLAVNDDLYLGYNGAGDAVAAYVNPITNSGTAKAYPKVKFTGGGKVYSLRNVTTGRNMYFNLTLNAGESAVLDFNPENPSFVSTFRGNLKYTVLPGSSWDFFLQPGANDISLFISGSTDANTAATMTWTPQYLSLDGAVY